ncbi:MAG: hypothetical protein K0S47_4067 [Herbinix sp.]|nr:hypothetical protein [Herbinix sp.]
MGSDQLLEVKCLDSLEKVFPDEKPREQQERITVLWGETASFQVGYKFHSDGYYLGKVVVETELPYRIRKVSHVPVNYPSPRDRDVNYLRTTSGLYPDLLEDISEGEIILVRDQWHSIWIDLEINNKVTKGNYLVRVFIYDETEKLLGQTSTNVEIIAAELPELSIKHTEWFYADCLADYYNVEVFSAEHWMIIEEFMKAATQRKCNTILTPIFTPPLDTYIPGERTTVQLVKVIVRSGKYFFRFEDLEKWVNLAHQCGFEFFEISHLFTQWGIKAAPKIMADVDGTYKRIFGWDTPATGGIYEDFLKAFLPELTKELKRLGIAENCYFHISDEPGEHMLHDYMKAKEVVAPYLEGFHMLDALSEYSFYEDGLVEVPACAIDRMEPFLEKKVPNLWGYYCCAQGKKVSNRFMAMPSYRNRILGIQIYLHELKGFLHWGYNFYNSILSRRHIDPYRVTDCDFAMPSGDSFLVYPGKDKNPKNRFVLWYYMKRCQIYVQCICLKHWQIVKQ